VTVVTNFAAARGPHAAEWLRAAREHAARARSREQGHLLRRRLDRRERRVVLAQRRHGRGDVGAAEAHAVPVRARCVTVFHVEIPVLILVWRAVPLCRPCMTVHVASHSVVHVHIEVLARSAPMLTLIVKALGSVNSSR
jgi:hypothetical protein